jgi:hypothetical protein
MNAYSEDLVHGAPEISSGSLGRLIALISCIAIFLLTAFFGVRGGYSVLAIITFCVMLILWRHSQQSLGIVLIFSAMTLYVVPFISLIYVDMPVTLAVFALFSITAYVMANVGQSVDRQSLPFDSSYSSERNLLIMVGFLVLGLITTPFVGDFGQPLFTGLAAVALAHLERAHWGQGSKITRWACLVIYAVAICAYAALFWDGFGRIVIISLLLLPVIVSVRYKLFRLSPLVLAGAGGAMVFIGRVLRFGFSEGIAGISEDSGATHIILSSELLANHARNTSGTTLIQQFELFFLNWAPRSIWPGKPININSLFVDSYLGRAGYSEEHSTALGFFGEQIYLAPAFWLLTVPIAIVMVLAVRALIARLAQPYYSSVVIYDVWLVTLFWGGMASFAARAWFTVVPLVVYAIFLNHRETLAPGRLKDGTVPTTLVDGPAVMNGPLPN